MIFIIILLAVIAVAAILVLGYAGLADRFLNIVFELDLSVPEILFATVILIVSAIGWVKLITENNDK